MPKEIIPFSDFLAAAGAEHTEYLNSLHEYLLNNGFKVEIKTAASGYVVSYIHTPTKRTALNYIFRKKRPVMRLYADNIIGYMEILSAWPDSMKEAVKKAGPCKRLINPDACNSRCPMGYDFILDGERQQKCRYGGFMFFLDGETKPYLKEMVECEVKARV
jgi:hypothetical protein